MISPDGSRYVTLLGHYHEEKGDYHEERQLNQIASICTQLSARGKKIRVMYERFPEIAKIFADRKGHKTVLTHLDDALADVPNCVVEDVEIRYSANSAHEILDKKGGIVTPKLQYYSARPFGEITFQDVIDEYDRHAKEIDSFVDEIIQVDPHNSYRALVWAKLSQARDYYEELKEYLRKQNVDPQMTVLQLSLERSADCDWLARRALESVSYLFDLHIFKKILESDPNEQLIVVAGGFHTNEVARLLHAINWRTRMCVAARLFSNDDVPLTANQLESFLLNELESFLLNETEWDKCLKPIYQYCVALKHSTATQFQNIKQIASKYCK